MQICIGLYWILIFLHLEGHCITCLNFYFTLHSHFFVSTTRPRLGPLRFPSCIKKLLIDNFCGGALSISLEMCPNVFLHALRLQPQGYLRLAIFVIEEKVLLLNFKYLQHIITLKLYNFYQIRVNYFYKYRV